LAFDQVTSHHIGQEVAHQNVRFAPIVDVRQLLLPRGGAGPGLYPDRRPYLLRFAAAGRRAAFRGLGAAARIAAAIGALASFGLHSFNIRHSKLLGIGY
jgi:hypothetical protein